MSASSLAGSLGLPARLDRSPRLEPTLADLLAEVHWRRRRRAGPELRKVLGFLRSEIAEARRLLARPASARLPQSHAAIAELRDLLRRDVNGLTIDSAWELAGRVKRLNVRLGDEHYVASLLSTELVRSGDESRWHRWQQHFDPAELDELLRVYTSGSPSSTDQDRAVDRLTFLYLQRAAAGRDRRAKAGLKARYLNWLAAALLGLLVAFGVTIHSLAPDSWKTMLVAACAGAVGAALSGVFKVRDHLAGLDELRGFPPAMRVQPLVGACAGLVVMLVLESQALSLGVGKEASWAGPALLSFLAGFSEPFFLGIVQKVVVLSERQPAAKRPGRKQIAADGAA
jgi:hypothetical protein